MNRWKTDYSYSRFNKERFMKFMLLARAAYHMTGKKPLNKTAWPIIAEYTDKCRLVVV